MQDEVTDRQILTFESQFFRHYGAKVKAIRDELGLGEVQFFARLREIVLTPAPDLAVEFGPLINRCRRRMEIRRAS